MDYRHEWKHEINLSDMIALRQRLGAVARADEHARDGTYFIRSLYFDNLYDKALREKIDGINCREKFRLRYYDFDTSLIHLEKKSKRSGLGCKQSTAVTKEQVKALIDGDLSWMVGSEDPLVQELYSKMVWQGMRPKTIVDYTREAYVYGPGNVRVTMDYDIRTGLSSVDFLNPACVTIPAGDSGAILEVKWDAFLPGVIRDAVQLTGRHTSAFSKYAACRIYG